MKKRMKVLSAIAAMSVSSVWAQTASDTMMMDHSQYGTVPKAQATPKAAPKPAPALKSMPGMDHNQIDHGAMPMPANATKPEVDHGTMDHATMPGMKPDPIAPAADMAGMNPASPYPAKPAASGVADGEMNMQGGPAPADARDPHAYSGGTTLVSGPYAMPPSQRLRLADEFNFASLLVDRLERSYTRDSNSTTYDAQAWFGRDYDRLVIKAEGEVTQGKLQEARTELLWGHSIATYWDRQLGVRYDSGEDPDRGWLAFGVQGLAPYWFEIDTTAYVGENGRTALRLAAEYELLLTQKLILQPRVELNLYGKNDIERGIGSGLSETQAGLRLRYEFTRQFAPYIGVERVNKFGKTADLARVSGENSAETRWVAGLRFWF